MIENTHLSIPGRKLPLGAMPSLLDRGEKNSLFSSQPHHILLLPGTQGMEIDGRPHPSLGLSRSVPAGTYSHQGNGICQDFPHGHRQLQVGLTDTDQKPTHFMRDA